MFKSNMIFKYSNTDNQLRKVKILPLRERVSGGAKSDIEAYLKREKLMKKSEK